MIESCLQRAGRKSASTCKKRRLRARIAAQNFCCDLNSICGCRAYLTQEAQNAVFLIGILGEDAAIDALTGDTVKDLRDEREGNFVGRAILSSF